MYLSVPSPLVHTAIFCSSKSLLKTTFSHFRYWEFKKNIAQKFCKTGDSMSNGQTPIKLWQVSSEEPRSSDLKCFRVSFVPLYLAEQTRAPAENGVSTPGTCVCSLTFPVQGWTSLFKLMKRGVREEEWCQTNQKCKCPKVRTNF